MDIVVGEARIYATGLGGWVLHGGYVNFNRTEVIAYAKKVNQLLQRRKQ